MKNVVLASAVLALLALFIPIAAALGAPMSAAADAVSAPPAAVSSSAQSGPAASSVSQASASGSFDFSRTIRLLDGGEVRSISMGEYLAGAVAAEMPASFGDEALRAQAVAIRTYTLHKMLVSPSDVHPQADVCSDSACCMAWRPESYLREKWGADFDANYGRIKAAAAATDGVCMTYSGEPVLAAFHSSSSGETEDSAAVWGRAVPYLVSVKSPETAGDVPNYVSAVTVSASDFAAAVSAAYPQANFTGAVSGWIGAQTLDKSGRISSVTLGGVSVSGTKLRSLFSLRSTAVSIKAEDGAVVMTSTGYGHGVGMSQYGANVMASQGKSWRDILAWYYPGVSFRSASSLFPG